MTITAYSTTRVAGLTTVTVTSDLSGTIYYHWYADGSHIGSSLSPRWSILLEDSDYVRITAQDTNDATYDPIANAPAGYPARRTLTWVRVSAEDIVSYRISENVDAGGWVQIADIPVDGQRWYYTYLTGRLTDLASYQWRITPVDNEGLMRLSTTTVAKTIVRTPDAPNFALTFDDGTTKVTFAAA